jgi:hypothetical protein
LSSTLDASQVAVAWEELFPMSAAHSSFIVSVRPTVANATASFQIASSRNNDHHDS